MKNFRVIFRGIYVQKIIDEIEKNDMWNCESLRTGPMMQQKEILLYYTNLDEMLYNPNTDRKETVAYPPVQKLLAAKAFIFELMKAFQGERLGRAFITCLAPGKKILPHTDTDAGFPAGYFNRYHLCLKDNEETVFKCGDEEFRPEVGDLFTFDNLKMHSVENNGKTDRWTFVIDIKKPFVYIPEDTFANILKKAGAEVACKI
jgi:Aspartyl/Asparaginyl beta-hydroxylase